MRKLLVITLAFLMFGGIAIGQEKTEQREYVADIRAEESQLTPEDLAEMEGEFYYNPGTTNQYGPNIERQRITYIRELILEGVIPPPPTPVLGIDVPKTPIGGIAGATENPGVKQPDSPKSPSKPVAPVKVNK